MIAVVRGAPRVGVLLAGLLAALVARAQPYPAPPAPAGRDTVSYTHLTLPTIYSV